MMTIFLLALAVAIGWIPILWVLYAIGILYEKGGWWRLLTPVTLAAALLDIAANYTFFSLYMWSKPQKGEYTISKHLERLVYDVGVKGKIAVWICNHLINPWDKVGVHVKLPDTGKGV